MANEKPISAVPVRCDIHIHLGKVYKSTNKLSHEQYTSPQEVFEFIMKCKITHAVIIYTCINEYRELRALVPENIKLYPIKWVIDPTQTNLFNEETVGVKLHHIRGNIDGENLFKDYDSPAMVKFLKTLPDGYLVCPHFQGASKVVDGSRPIAIAKHALKFPNLKFIIYHSGNFGLNCYYTTELHEQLTFVAMCAETAVFEACLAAEKLPNVFLDSSMLISPNHYKTQHLIKHLNKLALGSDFPFTDFISPGRVVPRQEDLIMRAAKINEDDIQTLHKNAVEWLETTSFLKKSL